MIEINRIPKNNENSAQKQKRKLSMKDWKTDVIADAMIAKIPTHSRNEPP